MKNIPNWLQEPILHPFFVAAFPCVGCMSALKGLLLPEGTIITVIVVEVVALVLLVLSCILTRSAIKGGLLCSALITYIFLYRCIQIAADTVCQSIFGCPIPSWIALGIYTLLGLLILPAVTRPVWKFGKYSFTIDQVTCTHILNVITGVLVVFNLIPFVTYEYSQARVAQRYIERFQKPFKDLKFEDVSNRPDIYYMILDGFANQDALKELWGLEDHKLVDYLKIKGFYVVPGGQSNYDRTEFSISSSLNLQYINVVPDELGKDWSDLNFFVRLIHDNVAAMLLKRNGYRFINISSWPNEYVANADENVRSDWFNDFTVGLLFFTPIYSLEDYIPLMRDLIAHRKLAPGELLKEVVPKPGPKFVFFHSHLSHAPCLFDADGKKLPLPKGHFAINWGTPAEYFAQWKYTEKKAIDWVEEILKRPGPRPIVIVQSDHGAGIDFDDKSKWYTERMHILNAYYFPGHDSEGLYATITPVNSFRILFNDYFHTKLPLLADKVYCAPNYERCFYWVDIRAQNRVNR